MNEDNKTIQDKILAAIESGKVKMRPRWHFVAQTSLLIIGTILVYLTLLYLASFILFGLRENGISSAPHFGFSGLRIFFSSLPWILVALAILFIGVLQVLVKKYSFGYGKPLLYSAAGIILLVVGGTIIIDNTHFHRELFRRAQENHLPFGGGFYRQLGPRHLDNVVAGTITAISANGYTIRDVNNEDILVVISPDTQTPTDNLAIGDNVVVLGTRQDNSIQALGIRKVDDLVTPPTDPHYRPMP